MRSDYWLVGVFDRLWQIYFADIPKTSVLVRFGRNARTRLGSIKKDRLGRSVITISGLMRQDSVPEFIVEATLFHEITHYAHGFNSPLERQKRFPHRGGVMRQEFAARGLEELYFAQRDWLKENWAKVITR